MNYSPTNKAGLRGGYILFWDRLILDLTRTIHQLCCPYPLLTPKNHFMLYQFMKRLNTIKKKKNYTLQRNGIKIKIQLHLKSILKPLFKEKINHQILQSAAQKKSGITHLTYFFPLQSTLDYTLSQCSFERFKKDLSNKGKKGFNYYLSHERFLLS